MSLQRLVMVSTLAKGPCCRNAGSRGHWVRVGARQGSTEADPLSNEAEAPPGAVKL